VVDASHPAWEDQAEVVGEVLAGVLADGGKEPRVVVALNKADLLATEDQADRVRSAAGRGWDAVLTAATASEGALQLRDVLLRTTSG